MLWSLGKLRFTPDEVWMDALWEVSIRQLRHMRCAWGIFWWLHVFVQACLMLSRVIKEASSMWHECAAASIWCFDSKLKLS